MPDQNNFDTYRLIQYSEAPKAIETHFVKNNIDPTGLGEPPFPPTMGALANALYGSATLPPTVCFRATSDWVSGSNNFKV